MSNRYVWGRYNLAYTASYEEMEVKPYNSYQYVTGRGIPDYTFPQWSGGPAGGLPSPVYEAVASGFSMSGNKFRLNSPSVTSPTLNDDGYYTFGRGITTFDEYFYYVTSGSPISGDSTFSTVYRAYMAPPTGGRVTTGIFTGNYFGNRSPCLVFCVSGQWNNIGTLTFETMSAVGSKGTANGTVSNSASSTYPPRDYVSKSARIWPYSVPFMRCSGRSPEYATKPLELDALSR